MPAGLRLVAPAAPDAVVDTNVLLRMLLSERGPAQLLRSALTARRFRLVTSEPQLEELRRTLRYPRVSRLNPRWSQAQHEQAEVVIRRVARVVPGHYDVRMVPADPDDDRIVACALEAGAQYLVSEDLKHLVPLKVVRVSGYRPIQVVRLRAFLRVLAHRPTPPP